MENIIVQIKVDFIEMFGSFIMEKFQKVFKFITSITIGKITISKICRWFLEAIICLIMLPMVIVGQILKNVKNFLNLLGKRQRYGMQAMMVENGTKIMQGNRFHCFEELDTTKNVCNAKKNIKVRKVIKDSVVIHVKHVFDLILKLIAWSVLVLSVKIYSFVINTLLRKHVVKNVQLFQSKEQKWVYDLTIEDDNCYYANGYLVSNSDAMRYLACSVPKVSHKESTPEELEERYQKAMYGPYAGGNKWF
jgi:hypothetical protein